METTREKLTYDQKYRIKGMVLRLESIHTFDWNLTSSGEDYWSEVYHKLIDLQNQQEEGVTSSKVSSEMSVEDRLKRIEKKLGIED